MLSSIDQEHQTRHHNISDIQWSSPKNSMLDSLNDISCLDLPSSTSFVASNVSSSWIYGTSSPYLKHSTPLTQAQPSNLKAMSQMNLMLQFWHLKFRAQVFLFPTAKGRELLKLIVYIRLLLSTQRTGFYLPHFGKMH